MKNTNTIHIKNKKAYFNYQILDEFTAGVQLIGLDIKLIRQGKVSIAEGYCHFIQNELYITGIYLADFNRERTVSHLNKTQRKLLLRKNELKKLQRKINESGLTLIPLELYMNPRGLIKITIALAKGKREYDKRHTIKSKENKRDLARVKKNRLG